MRVLALDYGSARCGAAVCDPTETVVTPIEPVLRAGTRAGIGALAALVGRGVKAGAVVKAAAAVAGGGGGGRDPDKLAEALQAARAEIESALRG